ncbi:MAG: S-layer homology domain-containing protein [Vallitaleaceae bacterium]|nr:S-layer homology domain-containing protein [Vallitaleaceae bacterium]
MRVKRIIALVLALFLTLQPMTKVEAFDRASINDLAEVLHELDVLRGDGTSFNLEATLRRSEAVAFVTRLMLKDEFVNENKADYVITDFTDVSESEWYAPYIGYGTSINMLNGMGNKQFKPNDWLSEKAFLKMLLVALGYEYNVDFTWENLYKKAHEVGLVKNSSYLTKTADNTEYKRYAVVEVLFNALSLRGKRDEKFIQSFINKGSLTQEKAEEYGLIANTMKLAAVSINATGTNTFEIALNEETEEVALEAIKVFRNQDPSVNLTPTKVIKEKTVIKVELLEAMIADELYSVILDNPYDLEGNKEEDVAMTLVGYRDENFTSDYFRIQKTVAMNNNTIQVYFTHPVNQNVLVASNYSLLLNGTTIINGSSSNMKLSLVPGTDRAVQISFLNASFSAVDQYELKISGKLVSAYTVYLKQGEGESIRFLFKEGGAEVATFAPIAFLAMNKSQVMIVFNKDINAVLAEQVYSYYITTAEKVPVKINKASVLKEGDFANKAVMLDLDFVLDKTKTYTIMINNLNDLSKTEYITEMTYTFSGEYPTNNPLEIVRAYSIDANTILLGFNNPLNVEQAETVSNYMVRGTTDASYYAVPSAVEYREEDGKYNIYIHLKDTNLLKNRDKYTVQVSATLTGFYGGTLGTARSALLEHNNTNTYKISASEAVRIADDTILLDFSGSIALDLTNLLPSNYSLYYTEEGSRVTIQPISVSVYEPDKVILKFSYLESKEYKLSFGSVIDIAGNKVDYPLDLGVVIGE